MGFFSKLFSSSTEKEEHLTSEDVIEEMLAAAKICMEQGKAERAFSTYQEIVRVTPDATAQHDLGVLYATGNGTKRDLLQAAYWFHQASVNGDEIAAKLEKKSLLDHVHEDFAQKTPQVIYQDLLRYAEMAYPDRDRHEFAVAQLLGIGRFHIDREDHSEAAKIFRAAAEYGDSGQAQNYLGVLYNLGCGVEQNDLAALYWFDRAADHQIEAARVDRDGILAAYRKNLSEKEFSEYMDTLAEWCAQGTADVPQDSTKIDLWHSKSGAGTPKPPCTTE